MKGTDIIMDNQRLKNFLTENTRRTAVLRIPGFIMILLSVILAFMPGFIFFYISIASLLPELYTY